MDIPFSVICFGKTEFHIAANAVFENRFAGNANWRYACQKQSGKEDKI